MELSSSQKKHLKGLAHHLEPAVQVGKAGITDSLVNAVQQSLEAHELIKVKFVASKEMKKELSLELAEKSDSSLVGILGNTVVLYREHPEKDKREITLPGE